MATGEEQTPILFSTIVGESITKEYAPEMAYNRIIVGRTTGGVYSTGSYDLGETPYLEKYISLPSDNTDDLDMYALNYLNNLREGWLRYKTNIRGIAIRLFQLLDLTDIQFTLNIDDPNHIYRVTDIGYSISDTGGSSSISLISKDYQIWDGNTRKSAGEQTEEQLNQNHIVAIVDKSLACPATVTATGTGTVTVEYDYGGTETIEDHL